MPGPFDMRRGMFPAPVAAELEDDRQRGGSGEWGGHRGHRSRAARSSSRRGPAAALSCHPHAGFQRPGQSSSTTRSRGKWSGNGFLTGFRRSNPATFVVSSALPPVLIRPCPRRRWPHQFLELQFQLVDQPGCAFRAKAVLVAAQQRELVGGTGHGMRLSCRLHRQRKSRHGRVLPCLSWPLRPARVAPVDAFQKIAKLDSLARSARRPDEFPRFEPLHVERHARSISPDHPCARISRRFRRHAGRQGDQLPSVVSPLARLYTVPRGRAHQPHEQRRRTGQRGVAFDRGYGSLRDRTRYRLRCLHVFPDRHAKMHDIDPQARLPSATTSRLPDLLPWNWPPTQQPRAA